MSEVGGPKVGVMNIGEEAKPPFAVLPNVSSLFQNRSKRLAALAPGHHLQPYLEFLAQVTCAQHDIVAELPAVAPTALEHIARSLEHGMPPLSHSTIEPDDTMVITVERLVEKLSALALPPATAEAIQSLRDKLPTSGRELITAALKNIKPSSETSGDVAHRVLILAALQVHFARLAENLDASDLKPVADGVCPTCGSAPMSSAVVGWQSAHNTRFCSCSLCATMWNVVRVKCVLCSSTKGITYRIVEGASETVKAETCDECKSYVKILYQVSDPALDPLADDVATLGLDILLAEEGWKRGGQNPFLLGY